ncbi:hypothetical protein G4B88_028789 [Cannabis sativa]|uniref:Uncharacterized protein n=1 Tax=Cannabis sativa TaxID=3483 RepID=A0A7J6FQ25_CANSA|nr:hypothetical protein G4B88_028789 [Cannabis sativa]
MASIPLPIEISNRLQSPKIAAPVWFFA